MSRLRVVGHGSVPLSWTYTDSGIDDAASKQVAIDYPQRSAEDHQYGGNRIQVR